MSQKSVVNEMNIDKESNKFTFCRIGSISALVIFAMIPLQIAMYLIWPHPTSIITWFELFQRNWFLGLIGFDFLYMLSMFPMILLIVSMFFTLFENKKSLSILAVILGLVSITIYFSSNRSIEMLGVSHQYARASSESEKTILLAAGQTFFSVYQGTAYAAYYIINGISLILFFLAMIPNRLFRKSTAYIGLTAGILMLVPATAGIVGMTMALMSLIPWSIFCILVSQDFNRIRRNI